MREGEGGSALEHDMYIFSIVAGACLPILTMIYYTQRHNDTATYTTYII